MKPAENTHDEKARLKALDDLSAVYSPAEGRLDEITRMACDLFDVPIALISLVAEDRQWFKSAQGLTAAETPRDISFCGHAIQEPETLVVEDAEQHPWFSDNPLVEADPNVRFYAGRPLKVNGQRIGTLCLIDHKPRQMNSAELEKLDALAETVEEKITMAELSEGQRALLKRLSQHERSQLIDPATRLWNRAGIEQVLLSEFDMAAYEKRGLVLAMFSLGGIAELAAEQGAAAADRALAEMASRLRKASPSTDALGRYRADTLVAIYGFEDEEHNADKVQRLMASLSEAPVAVGEAEVEIPVRAATMIAYSPSNLGVANLIILTDQALAKVQEEPPGTVLFFDRRQTPRES